MIKLHNENGRRSECGVALFIAIFTLLLITAIAAGMVLLTNGETLTSSNFRDEQTAFFAAKAGFEEVRDRFRSSASNSLNTSLPTALPGQTNGVLYVSNPTNSETDTPWITNGSNYPDDEICNEMTYMGSACAGNPPVPGGSPWYTTAAASATYATTPPMAWKWTRVTVKTNKTASGTTSANTVDGNTSDNNQLVCWNGTTQVATALATCAAAGYQQVYVLTTLAVTPSGSRRMLQSEVVKDQLNLPIPGALTLDGPSLPASTICASGATCNSGGDTITGNEPVSGSCSTGGTVVGIATSDATSQSNLATGVNPNKANITGSGGSPSVGNASSALSNYSTVSQIEALVSQMKTLAGSNTCTTSCGSLNLGTSSAPTVTVVDNASGSAFQLNSGVTGYGILVVTGTLDYVNVNSYQGVILMLGTAQFISSSSKDTTLTGALFLAQDRNPSTGALLAGPALGTSPVFNFHHGSTSPTDPSVQYNACVISQVESSAAPTYRALAQREMIY